MKINNMKSKNSVVLKLQEMNEISRRMLVAQGINISKTALKKGLPRVQPVNNVVKTGRNSLCPCFSGKKYKKCCWK